MRRDVQCGCGKILAVLMVLVSLMAFSGCEGEEDNPCDAVFDAFPRQLKGKMDLLLEELGDRPFTLGLTVNLEPIGSEDGRCTSKISMVQDGPPFCGVEFTGELQYSEEKDNWEGTVNQVENGAVKTNGVEMFVRFTQRSETMVEAYNLMESTNALCDGREIKGTLEASN